MKRVVYKNAVNAGYDITNEFSFTAEEVAQLLSQIYELRDCHIAFGQSPEGIIQFEVGDSVYQLMDSAQTV